MKPVVVAGSAHPALAEDVARGLGVELASAPPRRFPDGEHDVEVRGVIRGRAVFAVQPLGPPVGEHLLELLLLADACHRAGARTVTAVVPYVGLARQDRTSREGTPLGARVLADALRTGAFSQVIAVDLHSPVFASCLDAPVARLTAVAAIAGALRVVVRDDAIVVAPDLGAVKLAETYARLVGLPLAIVSKIRISPVQVAVRSVVGDVRGKRPIIVDDMISTGTTVAAAIDALLAAGCHPEVVVAATHGLFAAGAAERLARPEVVRVLATDSLPPPARVPPRLEVVPLAPLLVEAVRRIVDERGLDELLASR